MNWRDGTPARADFAKRTEGSTYVSPLPAQQKHPLELPWLNSNGSAETLAGMERQAHG